MTNPLALVVEDDNKQARIFAQALDIAQFETEIVKDGKMALERLAEVIPALVVLDMHLPHVTGDHILKEIRADERLSKTRVILATADPLMADMARDDSDLVLLKPISFSQLRDLAKRLRPPDTVLD